MMELKDYATLSLTVLGLSQGLFLYFRSRRDKEQAEHRKAEGARVDGISTKLEDHIKEDREMHDRLQRAETRLDGQQQQINDANARHGDLLKKLDTIQGMMLTKEDFKMLVEVIRGANNKS